MLYEIDPVILVTSAIFLAAVGVGIIFSNLSVVIEVSKLRKVIVKKRNLK